ncbi:MAG: hypothetical protein QME46_04565 [Thermoanaerobacteraceae bacterium]|nr:hypothetical protein [Thermoanaerobacteraceae bacterium]
MKRKIAAFLMISILILSLTSCSTLKRISGGEKSKEQTQNLDNGPPPALLNLEKDLDKMMTKVEEQVLKTPEEQPPQQDQGQQQGKQSGGGQGGQSQQGSGKAGKSDQQGDGGGSQQESGQANSQQNPNDISKMLPELEREIQNIHKTWNGLQPELLKRGVDKTTIGSASETLNKATTVMDTKDGLAFLKAINEFYRFMPDIEEKVKSQTVPGLKRLTYYTRDILYSTFSGELKTAVSDISMITDEWKAVKPQLKKGSENETNKLETSIDELKNSLDEKNKNLIKIKSKIVLEDIKALEEKQKK